MSVMESQLDTVKPRIFKKASEYVQGIHVPRHTLHTKPQFVSLELFAYSK